MSSVGGSPLGMVMWEGFFYGVLLFRWWLFGKSDRFKSGGGGGRGGFVGGFS